MRETKIISPEQCRAARGMLDWSVDDLVSASGVSVMAIHSFENGKSRNPQSSTMNALIAAFTEHGVRFLDNDGLQKADHVFRVFEGANSYIRLLDDVNKTLFDGDEVLFLMVDNRLSGDVVKEKDALLRSKGIKFRHLISDKAPFCLYPKHEYRCIPAKFFINNTQVIYGDKVATMINGDEKCLIVNNATLATSVKNLFELIWNSHDEPR